MSQLSSVTAVFDIGKTNKKFLLFDETYSIVYERQVILEETTDDDGDTCEDLDRLVGWLKREFHEACKLPGLSISTLYFSTYGASLVHLDANGDRVGQLYNYLKPYPDDLLSSLYAENGGLEEFSLETASPPLGMINSGLQLYWLKHKKPVLFSRIQQSLHLPQYLSYLFTGRHVAEYTSIGCHTAMWNFKTNRYHRWLEREGMLSLLPEVVPVSSIHQVVYKESHINIGPGIHDSSSALVPYLFQIKEPFIQVSTGTWSITMNPFTSDPLTYELLEKDCLQYMNIYGKPVKASRLFLGSEYSHQIRKLRRHFGFENFETDLIPDPMLLKNMVNSDRREVKLRLELANASGPYPSHATGNWDVSRFETFKEAYHQLMLDLVSIQADSLRLAEGRDDIRLVIITGGFSRNALFVQLLASYFPEKQIYTDVTSYASALGAALVMCKETGDGPTSREHPSLKRHIPIADINIEGYSWAGKKRHASKLD